MKNNQTQRAQRGFTLMELLAVIVIIGVLAAVIAPRLGDSGDRAKVNLAKTELGQIVQALDLYKLEVGRYPTAQEGLDALLKNPGGAPNWNGPYLRKDSIKDPFGTDYKYAVPGPNNTPFELKSLGADGREGGEGINADIVKS